jgi:hypothetical protein
MLNIICFYVFMFWEMLHYLFVVCPLKLILSLIMSSLGARDTPIFKDQSKHLIFIKLSPPDHFAHFCTWELEIILVCDFFRKYTDTQIDTHFRAHRNIFFQTVSNDSFLILS